MKKKSWMFLFCFAFFLYKINQLTFPSWSYEMQTDTVMHPFHFVLCNSVSHLTWTEGVTQNAIITEPPHPPKNTGPIENLQFNPNRLHQSQSWGKSILNWSKSWCSFRGHCFVYRWWLSTPDSAKWIWLNDITLERITTKLAGDPCSHFFSESLLFHRFLTQDWEERNAVSRRWNPYVSPELPSHWSL